ncbi:MAG: endopeptidase La [Lachnospiraceae bacterium]|nr:endopeptidase La [Lachnospiraceae bacterium]
MKVPVIALRGLAVLPGMVVHFDASRKMSIEAAQKAMASGQKILLVLQKDVTVENPVFEDLYSMGTLARVKQLIKMQGNVLRIMVEGLERVELMSLDTDGDYLTGEMEFRPRGDINRELDYTQQEAMLRILKDDLEKYGADSSLGKQAIPHLLECKTLAELLEQVIITFPFTVESRQQILEISGYEELYMFVLKLIREETVINQIKKEFQMKVKEHIDKSQKEYILREQMKVIREELGEDVNNSDDADEYAKRAAKLKAPKEVKDVLAKEISRFRMIPNGSQEGTVSRNYIEALLELPWNKVSRDNNDTLRARRILDEDHYGLEDVKKRVVEYLAVRAVTKKGDAPIICLAGPPGTGKTSIARSVAKALNKKYVRVCLGGVRDEAEIRGHRRTYIGSMPGRIAEALKQAGTSNPLILLDEIDKVSSDYKGDTSAALLEVLDSEQNSHFRDHFIEVPIDLSQVLFIATANDPYNIPRPLYDRMEVIEVSSYTENEKFHIATEHLIRKQMEKNGLKEGQLVITDGALKKVIHNYTREAGVRNLERRIADICRKVVCEILEEGKDSVTVDEQDLNHYLGLEKVNFESVNEEDEVGIVRGLAWTSVGGDTLQIEVNMIPGSGKLQLTGQLGDVMKESAQIALTYVKSVAPEYGISKEYFDEHDIHIHIPEGAVPKDGPSAGITMTTAILSAATGRKVHADLAMTGEVTLRGRVLPIGGLKEKLLAAKMAGIHNVLVPVKNTPNVGELASEITDGLNITYVGHMNEVIDNAFVTQ